PRRGRRLLPLRSEVTTTDRATRSARSSLPRPGPLTWAGLFLFVESKVVRSQVVKSKTRANPVFDFTTCDLTTFDSSQGLGGSAFLRVLMSKSNSGLMRPCSFHPFESA